MTEKDLIIQELRRKLKAYEDTGLTPEEILSAHELAEVACALNKLRQYQEIGAADYLRELVQAEKDGRLLVLPPCKVGDLIYEADLPEYGVITCEVLAISYYVGPMFHASGNPVVSNVTVTVEVVAGHGIRSSYDFDGDDFGKTVFLTCEEAEAALALKGAAYALETDS